MKKNWLLFKVYLIAGAFTFSGGMAMLPVIERELVKKKPLISKEDLYEYTTISQTLPGVIALTNACFVGKKINGYQGMFFAGLGAILPAYVLMSLATILYSFLPQEGPVLMALTGIRATSGAFLIVAALTIAKFNLENRIYQLIAVLCFLLTIIPLVSTPILIVASGAAAMIAYYFKKGAA